MATSRYPVLGPCVLFNDHTSTVSLMLRIGTHRATMRGTRARWQLVAAAFLCQELIVDARLRHLARDRFEELQELSVLVFYFYNPEESQLELGGAAWAAMEAHMRDLSTALGFSSHVGVTTWSQRNFGTLYMVTSPAYQALL